MTVSIRLANQSDVDSLARMRNALWPESSVEEHAREVLDLLQGGAWSLPYVTFAAEMGEGIVGFIEVGLRSHADGCDPAQPVGFIEGWYVADPHRHEGIGRRLVTAAETWALSQGCSEMASDALIDNELSQAAHEALGYTVVDRCVHYRKPIA